VSLRDELLRLLKEDEEFRLAVVGLLGITDVQATLKRLMDVVTKLTDNQATMLTTLNSVLTALGGLVDTMQKLLQEVKVLREDQAKLWQEVKALRENQERLWQEVKSLREDQVKLWQEMGKLWQEVRALRENQEKLWQEVKSLRENQEKLWQEVKALREDQGRLWQEVRSLREGQEALRKGQEALWREVRGIRRDLRDVKSTLEKYSITTEEEANDTVQYYLRQRGVVVETKPTFLNSGYEFDIYGTNGVVTIVGEAKVRAGPRTVERVNGKIEEAIKAMPNKFPGKIIKVLYCLRASPNTLEAANKYGIWLLESGRERNTPPLP
jgi:Zn-ribbon protein, possibly nucleic acid-binding